jgi:uncharacterized phage protein gp47/JayE
VSGTTSVPQPSFTDQGFVAPSEPAILAGAQADLNAAFGGGLNPALTTPQGQWASSYAAMLGDAYDQWALFLNSVDPAFASGRMQDAIGRIYFQTRLPQQFTTVAALCTGLAGTNIPTGATATATDGNRYTCTAGGTIPAAGDITLQFVCNVAGPITCPAGALSTIYQTVPGWDSITNVADGVVGRPVEGRAAFELRRFNSVAANSMGGNPAVLGAVLGVPGVTDCFVTDNPSGSPTTIDGVTVPAYALYVCVVGGNPLAVATAIWTKKMPGTPYATANTTETVYDNSYAVSPPAYTVVFETAIPQNIYILVNIKSTSAVPSNALQQIQTPVLAAFAGSDGGSRATINQLLFASRYYGGIAALGSWAQIVSIKLGTVLSPTVTFTGSFSGTVMTVTGSPSGTLAVNQIVDSTAAAIPAGMQIVSQASGSTGAAGTYNMSLPLTLTSSSLVATMPASDDLQIGAAHMPVLSAADIIMALI